MKQQTTNIKLKIKMIFNLIEIVMILSTYFEMVYTTNNTAGYNIEVHGLTSLEGTETKYHGLSPMFVSGTDVKLRLFGNFLDKLTEIGITEKQQSCDYKYSVNVMEAVEEHTITITIHNIIVDEYSSSKAHYICIKQNDIWLHQGTEEWKSFYVYKPIFIVPLWLKITLIIFSIALSSLMSGLNLGLMALNIKELTVISRSSSPGKEREYALAILPVRKQGNFLLCTILFTCTVLNAVFTVIMDDFMGDLETVIIVSFIILVFCEILPQALCSRLPLLTGAKTIYITKTLMILTAPITYPFGKLLDVILGKESIRYPKERLRELVKISGIPTSEEAIITGTLNMSKTTVGNIMTPLEDIYKLPITGICDYDTIGSIMFSGYSRIPIYQGEVSNIVNVLLTKDLAVIDPSDKIPIMTLCQYSSFKYKYLQYDTTLDIAFKLLKEGDSHMAFVTKKNEDDKEVTVGLVTLEDILEEMIQEEICDETDRIRDNRTKRSIINLDRTRNITMLLRKYGTHSVSITPQMKLAAWKYLSSVEPFNKNKINEVVLKNLLNLNLVERLNPFHDLESAYIYVKGKEADFFIMILEGTVEVSVGNEDLIYEAGPFACFGHPALSLTNNVEQKEIINDSGFFKPDYSVRAVSEVVYLRIERTVYLAALKVSGYVPVNEDHVLHRKKFSLYAIDEKSVKDHLMMELLIQAYQQRGHLVAEIDPLGITRGPHLRNTTPPKAVIRQIQLPSDLSKVFFLGPNTFIGGGETSLTALEIIKRLENAYCKSIGPEYKFITDYDQNVFLKERFETPGLMKATCNSNDRKLFFQRLNNAHAFESFLNRKYPSVKRFGLEGGEVLIPAMNYMIDMASGFGVEHFLFGMAHRGRLNVMANVINAPIANILSMFRALQLKDDGSGDVKYHIGVNKTTINPVSQKPVTCMLGANPSHLECVNPIVIGTAYARQIKLGSKAKVWPVLIHGDAAMSGQGVVYESFHLSELPCYSTDGVIHIVINNQVGFTTDPRMSRSSEYCTTVAKILEAPIIHVNGDDPDAVMFVMKIATEYKIKFKHSVVVDILCYRRQGHNEGDEPMYTQPIMYKKIKTVKPCVDLYSETLIKENVMKPEEIQAIKDECEKKLENALKESESIQQMDMKEWISSPWKGFFTKDKDPLQEAVTGVKKEELLKIGDAISTPPPDFEIHNGLTRILKRRKKMIQDGKVDFAIAEAFAFGSILLEGMNVRMSGQDCERGTFSHRHSVYHHQSKDKTTYTPLQNLSPKQGSFIICNSSLSEYGILGFELGISNADPNQLVLWEAQFGDFSNTAQCITDQFISAGESKWGIQSGLVMLLPHGMEGQGPEHSSCRPERYLQMANDDYDVVELNMSKQLLNINWFVVNPTTPANLFHMLRRQVKLNFRKPLVVLAPKSLLRDPAAQSPIDEMAEGTKFKPYLKDETIKDGGKVKRMLLCCGKVYYELVTERNNRKLNDSIAISRVEQVCPFPYADVIEDAKRYPNAQIFWAQEEHKNMGCWSYVSPRLHSALPDRSPVKYIGRPVAAAPAAGIVTLHLEQLKDFMNSCFKM